MDTNIDNHIKYYGTKAYENTNLIDFNQFIISSSFCIPDSSNEMDVINKVWAEVKSIESYLLKTPFGISYEGQILSGNKLLINGILEVKIEYISSNTTKNVESVYLDIPISSSVTLEDDLDECETTYPSILIEDVYCKKIDCRNFYLSMMMIAIVDVF